MFLESLNILGKQTISVPAMAKKELKILVFNMPYETVNAANAKIIPTA
jgi:hypothetical protein